MYVAYFLAAACCTPACSTYCTRIYIRSFPHTISSHISACICLFVPHLYYAISLMVRSTAVACCCCCCCDVACSTCSASILFATVAAVLVDAANAASTGSWNFNVLYPRPCHSHITCCLFYLGSPPFFNICMAISFFLFVLWPSAIV